MFSALWFFIFALPVLFAVPELSASRSGAAKLGFLASYGLLVRRIKAIYRTSPHTIFFLLASAIFRDGLAAVFTFGGVIAAGTFGFELKEVIFFAIFGNVVAAVGAMIGGFLDDRSGPRPSSSARFWDCWSRARPSWCWATGTTSSSEAMGR